jgi:arylsulfatase A-like enzyme
VVVFTSDHGDILGDHNHFSKGLFAYEGNVKVPLIFWIPGLRHSLYSHLVQSIDIAPTLLRVAGGVAPGGVQGVNLIPGFLHDSPMVDSVGSMIGHHPRLRMVRTVRYKYWTYGGVEYLFDLLSDPGEMVNLAGSQPSVLSEMRFQLVQFLLRAEDPLPVPRY